MGRKFRQTAKETRNEARARTKAEIYGSIMIIAGILIAVLGSTTALSIFKNYTIAGWLAAGGVILFLVGTVVFEVARQR